MEVCDICGCFVMGDAISRQEEHLIGKLHCGYSQIKATLEEFEVGVRLFVRVISHVCSVSVKRTVSGE
jgi:hypothetical protein